MSHSYSVLSRGGTAKPLSAPQIRALHAIEDTQVFYKPWFGVLSGVRADTFEVLEVNGLVRILGEPENPDKPERHHRHLVVLTDLGHVALARAPEVGPGPPPGGFRRRR